MGNSMIRSSSYHESLKRLEQNDPYLTSLNFSYIKINNEGLDRIANALKVNSTLTKLDLSLNDINNGGIEKIIEALKNNSTLTELDLSYNEINAKGLEKITEMLVNKFYSYYTQS